MKRIDVIPYTGTGAAINLPSFTPAFVKIYDGCGQHIATWMESMANASVLLLAPEIDSTTSQAAPYIGSTATQLASRAFRYRIASIDYTKAIVAAGTALTATTVPQNLYGAFGKQLAADGTLDTWDAADNATGYATEALAIAAIKAVAAADANHVRAFYCTVISTDAGGFVGATTALNDAAVTAAFYSFSDQLVETAGITPAGKVEGDTFKGITIGTNAYINTLGASYVAELIRG